MTKCISCGAEIVFGKPHELRVTQNGITRIETRCEPCMAELAWRWWPDDDDWGPFPYQRHQAGSA
jgi:hypothetical protein